MNDAERLLRGIENGIAISKELWPDFPLEWRMLTLVEEAGEVAGAFSKWHYGYRTAHRTKADIIEEMSQLLAILFTTADQLGTTPAELLNLAGIFLQQKAEEVRKIRESQQDRCKCGNALDQADGIETIGPWHMYRVQCASCKTALGMGTYSSIVWDTDLTIKHAMVPGHDLPTP